MKSINQLFIKRASLPFPIKREGRREGWKEKKKWREEERMEGFGLVETEDRPSWALGHLGKSSRC